MSWRRTHILRFKLNLLLFLVLSNPEEDEASHSGYGDDEEGTQDDESNITHKVVPHEEKVERFHTQGPEASEVVIANILVSLSPGMQKFSQDK